MSKKIESSIYDVTHEAIEQMGFELADVEYRKEFDDWVLTLYIYKSDGVTIDDCETVSIMVDPMIEEADPIPGTYMLSVSSLGIDRPFKTYRDYERMLDTEIEVHLYAPIEVIVQSKNPKKKIKKEKRFVGMLKQIDPDSEEITIQSDGVDFTFEKKQIALAKPMLRF